MTYNPKHSHGMFKRYAIIAGGDIVATADTSVDADRCASAHAANTGERTTVVDGTHHSADATDPEHDPFTIQHCTAWCDAVGIGAEWIPTLVQALADDGPDSTMSWPTVARSVGATFTDGIEYR